jgi:hypothetical protein
MLFVLGALQPVAAHSVYIYIYACMNTYMCVYVCVCVCVCVCLKHFFFFRAGISACADRQSTFVVSFEDVC